jgi:DNA replication protein DnaC
MLPSDGRFGLIVPCRCKLRELEERRLQDLRAASNLGLLSRMAFDSFVPDGHGMNRETRDNLRNAYTQSLNYAQNPQGWLILKGGYGCGKTHLAAAIANHQVERGSSVLFVVVPDLLDHLRATFSPGSPVSFDRRFETVRTAPLLVMDDLGTQSSTPWAQEKLYQILNYRYNAQLPTVITTNCELEELDARLRSRIAELEWSSIVTILAPDYRGSSAGRQAELSSLGLHAEQTFDSFDLRSRDPNMDAKQRVNLERTLTAVKNYASQPTDWLVLTGYYGCGKTHLAAAIANYRVGHGYPAIFVVVPDLLDHLRATYAPHSTVGFDRRFDEIRRATLLILDDLGTHSATPWAQEKLFQIFDYRYNARLPTVVTLNRDSDLDPRLATRLFDITRSNVREITAPSYRLDAGSAAGSAKRPRKTRRTRKGLGVVG